MKIVVDEKDKKMAENVNADLAAGENIPLWVRKGGEYLLKFKCTDTGLANAFINIFMNRNSDQFKECGIEPLALIYNNDKADIIAILEEALRKLKEE